MSVIEVQLGQKDRDRLGVGDTVLTVDEDEILDATFEEVHDWEAAWDVSLHWLLLVDLPNRTARSKRVFAFLACERAGLKVGAYSKFTITPNRCRLVEKATADVVPPADSSATSSEASPSESV